MLTALGVCTHAASFAAAQRCLRFLVYFLLSLGFFLTYLLPYLFTFSLIYLLPPV